MSYAKAMKWGRKHRKGTRQPIIMSTGSGSWPSIAFLEQDYWPYLERCKTEGTEPMECEQYYKSKLKRL